MAIIDRKKDKIVEQPSKQEGEITTRRPYDLWADMDNLFDQFKTNFDNLFWYPHTALSELRTPPMDLVDHGDKYEMNIEMPGINKENINIDVTESTIEISAKQEDSTEEKGKNWLRRERSTRSFHRSLQLPEDLKTNEIEAELKDGVLTLWLPKKEPKPELKPTKVKIK